MVDILQMATDEIHADADETGEQAAVGRFTVEARAEGVSEEWADVLAVRLAAMGLTVRVTGDDDD